MKCEEVKINIPEFIDGKLDKEAASMISTHLNNCKSCKETYTEFKSFLNFTPSFLDV